MLLGHSEELRMRNGLACCPKKKFFLGWQEATLILILVSFSCLFVFFYNITFNL
jgi:hypothetical protein